MPRYGKIANTIDIADKLDGRTREGRLRTQLSHEIKSLLGGNLTALQHVMVDQVTRVQLRMVELERRMARGEANDTDSLVYVRLINSQIRSLKSLGLRPIRTPATTPRGAAATDPAAPLVALASYFEQRDSADAAANSDDAKF